jgi:3-oxoacyl-[acyl-carrier protein] reductase
VTTLTGRVAVVTGSGTGIGRAIAIALAGEDVSVVTNNRSPRGSAGDAEATAKEIIAMGNKAVHFYGDISDFDTARRLMRTAVDRFGRLDILVNNAAGEDERRMPWEMTMEEWDSTLRTHLSGTFFCVRHACGVMKEQKWGRIINTTSRAWLETTESANYGAAMGGVVSLTRALARDLGRYGITCNAYAPSARTRRTEKAFPRIKRGYEAGVITRRTYESYANRADPQECTPLVLYLCSDEAAEINGQIFDIRAGEISILSEPQEDKVIRKEDGPWSKEDLIELVPKVLLKHYRNPAPAGRINPDGRNSVSAPGPGKSTA